MGNDTLGKSGLKPGSAILVVLNSPREKCWGMLDEISAAGVFLRGLDLNSFDDWISAFVRNEPFMGVTSLFFPMWRVERVTRDEPAAGVPSLAQQAEQRTGRTFAELMRDDDRLSD